MDTVVPDPSNAFLADRDQLTFLAEVGVQLSASLDRDVLHRVLAQLTIPTLADYCSLAIYDEQRFVAVAACHVQPRHEQLLRALVQRWPLLIVAPELGDAILSATLPTLLALDDPQARIVFSADAEHTRLLSLLAPHSLVLAPLVAQGRLLAVLTLAMSDPTRCYQADDLRLIRELTQRAALSIANAQLYAEARSAEAELRQLNATLENQIAERTADAQQTSLRLRAAIDGNLDAVYFLRALHDSSGQVIDFVFTDLNEHAVQALGMSREHVLGRQLCELLPINRSAGFFTKYVDVYHNGTALEEEFHLDTPEFPDTWLYHQVVPIPEGVAISSRNISASRRASELLRESEARFRSAFTNTILGMALVSLAGQWLTVNQTLCTMLGYSAEELTQRTEQEITHPADQSFDREQFARLRLGEVPSLQYEKRYLHRAGQIVWAQLSAACVLDGRTQTHYFVVQIMDVSERHAADLELKDLNQRLLQSNRELQEFASVASHDLQEPLRKIQAFSDRLRNRYGPVLGNDGLDYLDRMQQAAQRMQRLINDLLTFAQVRTRGLPFEAVALDAVLLDVIGDLEDQIERTGGHVHAEPLPQIFADATQMRQLFQNLISNALKFHRPDTPPMVQISAERIGLSVRPEAYRIRVADNGIGFDEKYLDRIFTIFQRLHARSAYDGTGIGLAICRRIVERHGGTLTASSRPDHGTTFIITLPVHAAGAQFEP